MKTGIVTALIFLIVFALGVLGGVDINWQSWFWGFAAGISVFKLVLPILTKR